MPARFPTDLAGRRQDLGLTLEQMAAGIGLRPAEVAEIEALDAAEDRLNHYATWLRRIEQWTADERGSRFGRARQGQRFA